MTVFNQTGISPTTCNNSDGNACAGGTDNTETTARLVRENGTKNATSAPLTVDADADNYNVYWFTIEDGISGGSNLEDLDGATGNWTFELVISNSNMFLDWTGAYACRVNSSCVNQETVCSDNTFTVDLGSTGVKSQTVNQGSVITMGSTDEIMCIYQLDNSSGMGQDLSFTSNGEISNQWASLPDIPTIPLVMAPYTPG